MTLLLYRYVIEFSFHTVYVIANMSTKRRHNNGTIVATVLADHIDKVREAMTSGRDELSTTRQLQAPVVGHAIPTTKPTFGETVESAQLKSTTSSVFRRKSTVHHDAREIFSPAPVKFAPSSESLVDYAELTSDQICDIYWDPEDSRQPTIQALLMEAKDDTSAPMAYRRALEVITL